MSWEMSYPFIVDGPNVDAEVDEVCVRVRVGLSFCNTLKFGLGLATNPELSGHNILPEVWNDVEDKGVNELVRAESDKLVEEVIFEIAVPQFDEFVCMNTL